MARYVAIGNSITAGYQSDGINDSTQARSYAVLLAQAAGTTFRVPALNRPGCQPPIADRKSTRLNSSHANISYAVFCLKKKPHQLRYSAVASADAGRRHLRSLRDGPPQETQGAAVGRVTAPRVPDQVRPGPVGAVIQSA